MTESNHVQYPANLKVLELANHSHAEVARILGYEDRRNVWPWTTGLRPFPPYHCRTLVSRFKELTLQELRPFDWEKHFPELKKRKDAPKPKTVEA